jgi:hypothetical protein
VQTLRPPKVHTWSGGAHAQALEEVTSKLKGLNLHHGITDGGGH